MCTRAFHRMDSKDPNAEEEEEEEGVHFLANIRINLDEFSMLPQPLFC